MMWGRTPYMYGGGGWEMGWGVVGLVCQLLFWGAVIYLLVMLFRRHDGGEDDALKILKERYAKGEISKKEFEEMKKDLG